MYLELNPRILDPSDRTLYPGIMEQCAARSRDLKS